MPCTVPINAGMTTSTRCSGGMPSRSARRGRRRGRVDSLMSRLTKAITASDAGPSASRAVSATFTPHGNGQWPLASCRVKWNANHIVKPTLPSIKVAR